MAQPPRIITTTGGVPPGVYVNDANINHSPWDFAITFSQLMGAVPEYEDGVLETQPREITRSTIIRLLMSPPHAKAFANALVENVGRYEEVFGPIPDVVHAAEEQVERLAQEGVIPPRAGDNADDEPGEEPSTTGRAASEPGQ